MNLTMRPLAVTVEGQMSDNFTIESVSSNLTQIFNPTRSCAEPMKLLCWAMVKVTLKSQMSDSLIEIQSISLCDRLQYFQYFDSQCLRIPPNHICPIAN